MIWEAITNTPWWVYLLFVYLLKIGFDATKKRIVSLKRLFILPLFFLAISVNTLVTSFSLSILSFSAYLGSFLIGVAGGWMLIHNIPLKYDKQRGLIQLPGSWITLIIIMAIFSSKYYLNYSLALDPTLQEDTNFEILMLTVTGAFSGLSLGCLFCYLFRKNAAPHFDLT